MTKNKKLKEILHEIVLNHDMGYCIDDGEMTEKKALKEILKHYIPISEIKEGSYEDGYLDGFEKGKGVVMGTTDCIPIDEIKILIAEEITVANSEGQPTSRLTSLYNKLSINKTNKEEEWVWCTECGKEKVYDGTICNSCKEWLVK